MLSKRIGISRKDLPDSTMRTSATYQGFYFSKFGHQVGLTIVKMPKVYKDTIKVSKGLAFSDTSYTK
jgi:hypothetical protein